ncbi:alpha/beta hydrolase [Leifsonia sp. Leaf264]|uniref:alpha/beta hydrolase n=1 Tax=Leifsonia sp. Leaf264 TaxID=1736314 RepID=UPI0006FD715F|nr:alpha/beta hydrolase [Leifsonia sp. Leaf264]KQP01987.1 esterase [Leifsonia sp. Leaf264]
MAELDVREDEVAGRHGRIPIRRYVPTVLPLGSTVVWIHGGAFSHGDLDMPESDAVARAVALTGRHVIAVDYRRVPPWSWWKQPRTGQLSGVRYPLPVDDVVDVLDQIQSEHAAGDVILGGASAGACLAAAAALRQYSDGRPTASGLLLAYGIFHAALPPIPSELRRRIRGRHSVMQFRPDTVNKMNRNYAGSLEAMRDPFAFPGGHDLRGMPPTLVIDADHDSLRASGHQFANELREANVSLARNVVAGSSHGFLNRPGTAHFAEGIDVIAEWVRSQDGDNRLV